MAVQLALNTETAPGCTWRGRGINDALNEY